MSTKYNEAVYACSRLPIIEKHNSEEKLYVKIVFEGYGPDEDNEPYLITTHHLAENGKILSCYKDAVDSILSTWVERSRMLASKEFEEVIDIKR